MPSDQMSPGGVIVSLVPVALWVIAIVCAVIAVRRGPRPISFGFVVERLLRYILIFPLGVQSLWAFFCHVFIPEQTAVAIGWATSPFQYEVGVANLGIGIASLYAAFAGFGVRAAVAVMATGFLGGAGIGHIRDIASSGNFAPGNAGPILYTDFLTPIAVLVLLLMSPRSKPVAQQSVEAASGTRIEEVEAAPAPRLEDELEAARQALRESLAAGPMPEILPPVQRMSARAKSPRLKGTADITDA
jgi:Na+/melibiose symporter-like transporter